MSERPHYDVTLDPRELANNLNSLAALIRRTADEAATRADQLASELRLATWIAPDDDDD